MKNIYLFCSAVSISIAMAAPVSAQQTFDSKKKSGVNTTPSFQSRHIKGSAQTNSRTAALPVQNSTTHHGQHRVVYSAANDLPAFIETKRNSGVSRSAVRKDFRTGSFDYLSELGDILDVKNASSDFVIQRVSMDKENRSHVRLNQ